MTADKSMTTYAQFLKADHLSRVLLMKHSQESSLGSIVLYGDIQVWEAFQGLANELGYRVEKIVTAEDIANTVRARMAAPEEVA